MDDKDIKHHFRNEVEDRYTEYLNRKNSIIFTTYPPAIAPALERMKAWDIIYNKKEEVEYPNEDEVIKNILLGVE